MTSALLRRAQRQYLGLYRGLVVDTADPQQRNRVRLAFPSLPRSRAGWAATLRDPVGAPKVGDEVLVGFEAGRLASPYVVGVLATAGTPTTLDLSDENGNSLRMSPSGIEIAAAAELSLSAPTIRLRGGTGESDGAMWSFAGVVKAQTLVADAVIASSYTPGTGNLM